MDPYQEWTQPPRSNDGYTRAQQPFQYAGEGLTFPAQISIRALPTPIPQSNYTNGNVRQTLGPGLPHHPSDASRVHTSATSQPRHDRLHQDETFRPQEPIDSFRESARSRQPNGVYSSSRQTNVRHNGRSDRLPSERQTRISERESRSMQRPRPNRLVTNQAEYDIIRPLGTSNTFFLVENVSTKKLYAQKRISMATDQDQERARQERDAFKQIRTAGSSLHITGVHEGFYDGVSDYSSLVLEYCEHGSIEDFIYRYVRERKICPENFAWHVLEALASALCLCHYGVSRIDQCDRGRVPQDWEPLCHLDIRPRNVLVTSKHREIQYPRIVLGDFSCVAQSIDIQSGSMDEVVRRHSKQGWQPPESYSPHERGIYGKHTDIWQVGGVIQTMCRLYEFPDQVLADECQPCGCGYSNTLNHIVSWCMKGDLRNRPTALDLLEAAARRYQAA